MSDRQAEDKLREQKIRLDTALENMPHGLCMFDREGRIALFNDRYAQLMGLSSEFLRGRSLLDVFRQRKTTGDFQGDPEQFFAHVLAEMSAGTPHARVMITTEGRALRVTDQPMARGGWIATFEDITDWRNAQAQIAHMARHDALTNLPNRVFFREELDQALRHMRRDEQIAVLCLDLDHFKDVNDTLGHPIGDDLLKEVASRLTEAVGETDLVARLGGDEFAVLQRGTASEPSDSAMLASRLVNVIGAPYEIGGHHLVIGLSVGVSIAPIDTDDADQLLKNADMALYRAKGDGRGTYRFFEPGMDARAQARRVLELELRTALAHGEFDVHYQPIHDLQENRFTCFEALVRWIHPLRGTIPPGNFISLAEETGLIVPLGEWVLRKACADAATWPDNLRVAVNLSPVQFGHRGLVSAVQSAVSQAGLAPERLELEITESVLLRDSESTLEKLHALRSFGVRISMDDFGTGYSSLSYLRSFPFDKIKLDRSFIQELATRDDCIAIVRAVAGLGQSLGISTTAEGVETEEQLALIRAEGCTEVQGFLFSKPRPAKEIAELLAAQQTRQAVAGKS
jgi:diguanylate cyclase (GGDEF)-like protein/PAS domain S-box-containing protein